ncbi:MAG: sugar transferase [Candidatus Marinimicrobia bacterium]|nr:sugar transferase [Candidatus Neomarinimicrobiota bacterium]MBT5271489.1 sugar transferase [Candidatus Neomarinimicrobiota bacterium]
MKRVFDFMVALVGVALFFPLFIIVAVLVLVRLGRPVFFYQVRPGKNSRPFEMVKFRTMLDARDSSGGLLSDSERLTKFGRFLRSTSLDELPELWNVLMGEMSLVGPRPLLLEYLPLYSVDQMRRHEIRPGITGWAQVNGRNALSWEEKFKLDIWYVDNQSFWLDLKILFMTVKKVVVREGISAKGDATMPVFAGKASGNNE